MGKEDLRLIKPTGTLDDMGDPSEEISANRAPVHSRRAVLRGAATGALGLVVAGAGYKLFGRGEEKSGNPEAWTTNKVVAQAQEKLFRAGGYKYLEDFERELKDPRGGDPNKLALITRTDDEGLVDGVGVLFSPTGEKGKEILKLEVNEPGQRNERTHIGMLMSLREIAGISYGIIDPAKPSYAEQLARAANSLTVNDALRNQQFVESGDTKGLYVKDLVDNEGFRLKAELNVGAGTYGVGIVFPDEGPHIFTPELRPQVKGSGFT